jgi:hypothetical protein
MPKLGNFTNIICKMKNEEQMKSNLNLFITNLTHLLHDLDPSIYAYFFGLQENSP